MQVYRDLTQLPTFDKAVVTIGSFDGVHLGHQKIIRQVIKKADAIGGESVIITFYPHPKQVLFPATKDLHLINTLEEKILLLEKQGIDHLIIVPFTKTFSQISADEYIRDFLVEKTHPHTIIIGYDHHFGHHRQGDIHMLEKMGERYHYQVEEIPKQVIHDLTISSTKIRKYLQEGKIRLANELLGYPYFIHGKVIHGNKRGRKLGFPTANIDTGEKHKLIPMDGIYVGEATIPSPLSNAEKENHYGGAVNIGHAPTFNGTERRVEIFIFDFKEEIYEQSILLRLHDFVRPDIKFEKVDDLVEQMEEDVTRIKERLEEINS